MRGVLMLALVAAAIGAVALGATWRLRRRTGLPSLATIAASDVGQERPRTYRDAERGLLGKPDYVIRRRLGWRGLLLGPQLVVVEAKPTRRSGRSGTLYESDELELVTNMLAVRAEVGDAAAPLGYVVYADRTFAVRLTAERERRVLARAEEARAVRRAGATEEVRRSHEQPGRCRGCAVRGACGGWALPQRG